VKDLRTAERFGSLEQNIVSDSSSRLGVDMLTYFVCSALRR
jgi:hypothetical protein